MINSKPFFRISGINIPSTFIIFPEKIFPCINVDFVRTLDFANQLVYHKQSFGTNTNLVSNNSVLIYERKSRGFIVNIF